MHMRHSVAGFHLVTHSKIEITTDHAIHKVQKLEMKEGKYRKSVAKFQGGAIFHMRDIRRI